MLIAYPYSAGGRERFHDPRARGYFVSDRRRNNPNWTGGNYGAFAETTFLSPDSHEGSEYGYLMETVPIVFNTGVDPVQFGLAASLSHPDRQRVRDRKCALDHSCLVAPEPRR